MTIAVVADRPSALGEADRYQLELFDAWTGRFLEEISPLGHGGTLPDAIVGSTLTG